MSTFDRRHLITSGAFAGLAALTADHACGDDRKKKKNAKSNDDSSCEHCNAKIANTEATDDLVADIKLAIETSNRDPRAREFLEALAQVGPQVRSNYPFPVFRDVRLAATSSRCIELTLGDSPLPRQARTHKHGTFDYRYETRSAKIVVYATICHPDINDFRSDAVACAREAAIEAVIVAVITESPQAGMAIFGPAFFACMQRRIGNRAREVTATLDERREYACWTNHC